MLIALNLGATTYYVDPASGDMSNDGSSSSPWSTWEDVIKEGKVFEAGDIIILKAGYHGNISLKGHNPGEIMIRAANGEEPAVKGIDIDDASNWIIDGLIVSPEKAPVFEGSTKIYAIHVSSSSHHISIENSFIYTVLDTDSWSQNDWTSKAIRGMMLRGPEIIIRNNYIKNVDMGIIVQQSGVNCLLDSNTIESFSEDAMRILADSCIIRYNEISDSRNVDQQHNDLVQSWPIDGRGPRGLKFIGNYFHSFAEPGKPYSSTAMGIGLFNGNHGPYEGAEIYNNIIVNTSYNGIMITNPTDCIVINNTIMGIEGGDRQPYIHFSNIGTGVSMTGNICRNNMANFLKLDAGVSVTTDHNLILSGNILRQFVMDAGSGDYRLDPYFSYEGQKAIDAGSADGAPATDIAGVERPQGDGVDIGAHECTEVSTMIYNESADPNPNRYIKMQNPLVQSSAVSIILETSGHVNLALFDIHGKLMNQVIDQRILAGSEFTTKIDRTNLASGAYVYKLHIDDQLGGNGILIVR